MPEKHHRLLPVAIALRTGAKPNLEHISMLPLSVKFDPSSKRTRAVGCNRNHGVNGGLVIGRRLDKDKLARELE